MDVSRLLEIPSASNLFSTLGNFKKVSLQQKNNKYRPFYYTAENNKLLDTLNSIEKRTFF